MAIETERRFLVFSLPAPENIIPDRIVQGYLKTGPFCTVRVRQRNADGFLTIKGKKTGASAQEFEYALPADDIPALLALCGRSVLTKDRYNFKGPDGQLWEIDFFTGNHQGLVIAELELRDENESFIKPDWLGPEITHDARFSNAHLVLSGIAEIKTWLGEYDRL